MHIITLGCNHNTASLELRESLNISSFKLNQVLAILKSYPYITGCVILSTCNRTEIYVSSRNPQGALESIIEFLKNSINVCLANHRDSFYVFNTKDSIRHIFRVASGLDSMVVGETQILGQVKNAYSIASREKTTSKILNMIFQRSFNIAKKIRHNSAIGRLPVSVSSVALKLLIKNFKSLDNKKVLIVGSGKISELTARGLLKNNVREIFVANRTFSSARSLARIFNARCIKFFEIIEYLRDIDILISCTSAPHLIIKR